MASELRCEVAVLGSGPGGAVTASVLAEAGRDVVMLEEGPWLDLDATPAFTTEEMRAKYRNGGVTATLGAPKIAYAEGRCVGGGSEINSGLYHRTPPDVLERWRTDFVLSASSEADLQSHYETIEADLSVSVGPGPLPPASLRLQEGARQLGWKSLEVPRWFRHDGNGTSGTKQSMSQTYVPRAVRAGCRLHDDVRVLRLERDGAHWRVRCLETSATGSRTPLDVRAETVVVSCGAIQTPALLRRSGIRKNVANSLHMHPTVKAVAEFAEEVNAPGVPAHQVKEFAPRISLGCSISSPPHLALALADHPDELRSLEQRWPRMATYYAMTTGGSGFVRNLPIFRDPLVYFRLRPEELGELAQALHHLCLCLLRAGAIALYPSIAGSSVIRSEADLVSLPDSLPRDRTSLMTIHTFSTCPMGENLSRCAADSFGRVHGVENLRIADGSLLCDPPGVNPQGSIMAFARRNALHLLGKL